jgi:hypothetical protein
MVRPKRNAALNSLSMNETHMFHDMMKDKMAYKGPKERSEEYVPV